MTRLNPTPNTTVAQALASMGFPVGSYRDVSGIGTRRTHHDPATMRVMTQPERWVDGDPAQLGVLYVVAGGTVLFMFPAFSSEPDVDGYGRPRQPNQIACSYSYLGAVVKRPYKEAMTNTCPRCTRTKLILGPLIAVCGACGLVLPMAVRP